MKKPSDQVFQLSLTEIAFTLVFLLLLLLGYMVVAEESRRKKAEERLAASESAQQATAAATTVRNEIRQHLTAAGAGHVDLDAMVTRLIAAERARSEQEQLRQQVRDLDAALTALTEVKATKVKDPDAPAIEIASALAVQAVVKQEMNRQGLPGGLPAEFVREAVQVAKLTREAVAQAAEREVSTEELASEMAKVVEKARKYDLAASTAGSAESAKKETVDLRGQVAFLKKRLDARGGRDYPPCWADETGKVEFLFNIELRPDSVAITPGWPQKRDADAKALPGLDKALSDRHSFLDFRGAVQGVSDWAKRQDPQCRHYVQLKSFISDAVQSDRARLMVEDIFYKVEARR